MDKFNQKDFLIKSDNINPKISYKIYLLPHDQFIYFFKINSELLQSLIDLYKLQYKKTDEEIKDYSKSNIVERYINNFSRNKKILLMIINNSVTNWKITEIGSIAVITEENNNILTIYNVLVMPSYRGNKLCEVIMNVLIDDSLKLKDKKITLGVFTNNDIAIKCYQKIGFEIINLEKPLYLNFNPNLPYYTMILNEKLYFLLKIKNLIIKLLNQSQKDEKLKDEINILLKKL